MVVTSTGLTMPAMESMMLRAPSTVPVSDAGTRWVKRDRSEGEAITPADWRIEAGKLQGVEYIGLATMRRENRLEKEFIIDNTYLRSI